MPDRDIERTQCSPLVGAVAVAEQFHISERTVKRLAATGEIPSYRAGRQLRFDIAEVMAALRASA